MGEEEEKLNHKCNMSWKKREREREKRKSTGAQLLTLMAIESLLIHKRPENVKRKHTGKEKKGAGPTGTKEKKRKERRRKNTVPAMSGIVSEESSHLYIVVFPFLAGCSAHLFYFPV